MAKKIPVFSEQTAKDLLGLLGKKPGRPSSSGDSFNIRDEWPRAFRNDSGETVPAYGCMRVTDAQLVDGVYMLIIAKPNGTGGPFVFNNQFEVEAGNFGTYQRAGVVRAKAGGAVACGECWGPLSDWEIVQNGDTCAVVLGEPESGLALAKTVPDSECVESASDSQSDFFCTQIPGVDLDSIEEVAAETVDFVLAIRNGCLVKVAVSDCAASGSV